MREAKLSRETIVERLTAVFREHGYEGASLARLSEATGLFRSSLYHHFPNGKEDMAKAVLASVDAWLAERVFAPLAASGTPTKRVSAFTGGLAEFYDDGRKPCLIELFGVGEARSVFQAGLRDRIRAFVRALADVAEEAGVSPAEAARRAEDALIALQGALVVSRGLGSQDPFKRVLDEMPKRLLASHSAATSRSRRTEA